MRRLHVQHLKLLPSSGLISKARFIEGGAALFNPVVPENKTAFFKKFLRVAIVVRKLKKSSTDVPNL